MEHCDYIKRLITLNNDYIKRLSLYNENALQVWIIRFQFFSEKSFVSNHYCDRKVVLHDLRYGTFKAKRIAGKF